MKVKLSIHSFTDFGPLFDLDFLLDRAVATATGTTARRRNQAKSLHVTLIKIYFQNCTFILEL